MPFRRRDLLLGGGAFSFFDDFNRADGLLGAPWTGATWAMATNAAVNTPVAGSDVIVNGAFATDTNWTKGGGAWTIAAGVATKAAGIPGTITAAVAPLTLGVWYQAQVTVSNWAANGFWFIPGSGIANPAFSANGTFIHTFLAVGTAAGLDTNTSTGADVDNLSYKALTTSQLFASLQASVADVLADVNVTGPISTSGIQAGLVVNLDNAASPANFVIAYLDGAGNAKLDKCVGGTYSNVISAAVTYSAGATLRVIKSGTSYSLFYNGAAVGSTSTISDAGIISNSLVGLFSTSALNSLDNFRIAAR